MKQNRQPCVVQRFLKSMKQPQRVWVLSIELCSHLCLMQVGSYVLDFRDPSSKLSVKNVQLVLANDDTAHRTREQRQGSVHRKNGGGENNRRMAWDSQHGNVPLRSREWNEEGDEGGKWAGEETTLLSFAKSDADEFSLDFRWPLTPMQAFGMALAALDTNI